MIVELIKKYAIYVLKKCIMEKLSILNRFTENKKN